VVRAVPDVRAGVRGRGREQVELAQAFGIQSIPTLMVVRDGVVVYAQPGALPAPALADLIGKVRELDMDEVRAKVEAAAKEQ
jgi:thioredoxin 1